MAENKYYGLVPGELVTYEDSRDKYRFSNIPDADEVVTLLPTGFKDENGKDLLRVVYKASLMSNAGAGGFKDHNTTFNDKQVAKRVSSIASQFYEGVEVDGIVDDGGTNTDISIEQGNLLTLTTQAIAGANRFPKTSDYIRYVPGYEFGMWFTTIFKTLPTGDGYIRYGAYDGNNGFGIGYENYGDGLTFYVFILNGGNWTRIKQADFNLDTIDGNGNSGFNVDITKGNIFNVSGGYLGFAPITFSVMNDVGETIPFHRIRYPNNFTTTNLGTVTLPAGLEVSNGTVAEVVSAQTGSFNLYVVDGDNAKVNDRSFGISSTGTLVTPFSNKLLVAFRNKETFQGYLLPAPIENRIFADLRRFNLALDNHNREGNLQIVIIPSSQILTGTWTDINTLDSVLEYSTDATFDLTNAVSVFADGFIRTSAKLSEQFSTGELRKLKPGETALFLINSSSTQNINYVFNQRHVEEH